MGQPIGQLLTPINNVAGQKVFARDSERGGFQCLRMNYDSFGFRFNHFTTVDFCENRRQSVVVVLCPAIEWVIVAVGTS